MTEQGAFKDHFSSQAEAYQRFRPDYPPRLFAWIAAQVGEHRRAWDCGCGNGQAAHGLVPHFDEIIATDPSAEQIARARPHPAIRYFVATAEDSGLATASVDLAVVAQALHWFDFPRFFAEVRRVVRPGGVLAAIAYGEVQLGGVLDQIADHFYRRIVGPYWPPERRHIDEEYDSIPFPFPELEGPELVLTADWDLDHLLGYFSTWSAVKAYRHSGAGDPVPALRQALAQHWGNPQQPRRVRWPLYLRVGRIGEAI
jgi:SAM-dependent methyltransferase